MEVVIDVGREIIYIDFLRHGCHGNL